MKQIAGEGMRQKDIIEDLMGTRPGKAQGVIPAKAGIQEIDQNMDSCFRRNDRTKAGRTGKEWEMGNISRRQFIKKARLTGPPWRLPR